MPEIQIGSMNHAFTMRNHPYVYCHLYSGKPDLSVKLKDSTKYHASLQRIVSCCMS